MRQNFRLAGASSQFKSGISSFKPKKILTHCRIVELCSVASLNIKSYYWTWFSTIMSVISKLFAFSCKSHFKARLDLTFNIYYSLRININKQLWNRVDRLLEYSGWKWRKVIVPFFQPFKSINIVRFITINSFFTC